MPRLFFPRIFTDLHELAAGSSGFTVQSKQGLFVNGKVFQECRGDYNRMVVLEMELADRQEKILAVLLSRHPAIQPSSQELKKEHNFMPCGARYSFSSG